MRLFARAQDETARLVELLPDDVAPTPAAALGAGGSSAALRARRLIGPHRPLGRFRAALTSITVAVLPAL